MHPKRRRADIVGGKELLPYGNEENVERKPSVPFKDRGTDELAWRHQGTGYERRKGTNSAIAAPPPVRTQSRQTSVKKKEPGVRAGYNPYDRSEVVAVGKPAVRRNLRELGKWLKGRPKKKVRQT